jgi:hypothetical protein
MKFASLIIIIAIRFFYAVPERSANTAFGEDIAVLQPSPAKFVSFKCSFSTNKILLQWVVNENETADQFEIQRSIDGKHFSVAALVFGTDKPAIDSYQFYERVNSKKSFYRVKLIDKDQQTEYSTIVEVDPAKQSIK